MKYTNTLFESIKEALNKKGSDNGGNFKDFMKLEIGKTYVVRLVPNLATPERTIFNYYHHLWKSVVTQELISVLCPTTYGETCPIDQYRSKIYKTQDKEEIERIKPIKRNENWLVNVYVIKDPTNPENQGQMKILRYGKQLNNIIESAMTGDDAKEFGAKIFDLTENGCNLRIKVEENEGGYPTYVSSRFLSPGPIEGDPDTDELHNSVKSLDTIFEHKSNEEIERLLKVHFLGESESKQSVSSKPAATNDDEEAENFSPTFNRKIETKQTKDKIQTNEDDLSDVNDRIQDILKDL